MRSLFLSSSLISLLCILPIRSCSHKSTTKTTNNQTAIIEVVHVEEPFSPIITYSAKLFAPEGTKLRTKIVRPEREEDGFVIDAEDNGVFEFFFVHRLYFSGHLEENYSDQFNSGINTLAYNSRYSSAYRYTVLPDSGGTDAPIENLAYFPEPGKYELSVGETFVLFRVEDRSEEVTLMELPQQ